MPLYEYECQQCHRRTEKRQKFSDPEITECPHCGGHLERVISAPAIAFKGGGWYKDLYSSARPAPSGESKNESKTDAASAPAPAGSGDSSATATTSSPAPASTPASPPATPGATNKN